MSASVRLSGCVPGAVRPPISDFAAHDIVDARSGATRRLDSLWREAPVVILFLRRLGCALCRITALEYSDARATIEAAGANLVAISFEAFGTGSDTDGSFEKGRFFTGPVYTVSPDLYEVLFGRKVRSFVSLRRRAARSFFSRSTPILPLSHLNLRKPI